MGYTFGEYGRGFRHIGPESIEMNKKSICYNHYYSHNTLYGIQSIPEGFTQEDLE